jgi:hypothetical protein
MTSIRKRRRQIARIAAGPARAWPWVRVSRYGNRRGGYQGGHEVGSFESVRFLPPGWQPNGDYLAFVHPGWRTA